MRSDQGSGTLSAAIGLTVVLTMLLGTVNLVGRLHRTSVAGAVAAEAAHLVARTASPVAEERARQDAEARIRRALGTEAEVRWHPDADGVSIDLVVPVPRVPGLSATVRRGARARWERPA